MAATLPVIAEGDGGEAKRPATAPVKKMGFFETIAQKKRLAKEALVHYGPPYNAECVRALCSPCALAPDSCADVRTVRVGTAVIFRRSVMKSRQQ